MWQRIQTIFLALVVLLVTAALFFPVWSKQASDASQSIMLWNYAYSHIQGTTQVAQKIMYAPIVLGFLAIVIASTSIFSYKNRLMQIKLNIFNSLVIAAFFGVSVYTKMQVQELFEPQNGGTFGVGFFLPVAALLFNSLATRFIQKDDKMVKDADRLR